MLRVLVFGMRERCWNMCRADLYVVLTPDRDIYVEELGLLNAHVRNIRVRAHPGVAPPG